MNVLKKIFALDYVRNNPNLDIPQTTEMHKKIINQKKFLKNIYSENYLFFKKNLTNIPDGIIVELGSGGGFIKEVIPNVITSDILPLKNVDKVFSATDMPFKNNSLSAILMIDVFHHIKDVYLFLKEAERCLKKNGKIIMIEPSNTLWGRFIYKNFHHEPFNPNSEDWKLQEGGPLSNANGALPWIVFERDKEIFNKLYVNLEIQMIEYAEPFRYLISGGVSMKQLMPDFTYPLIKFLEDKVLKVFAKFLGMFMKIQIIKR